MTGTATNGMHEELVEFDYGGQQISLTLLNTCFVSDHIRETRSFYELEFLRYLGQRLSRETLIFDVGAHIGNHTIFFAKVLGTQVLAFEPNPLAFKRLEENVARNGVSARVTCYPFALSDEIGHVHMQRWNPEDVGSTSIVDSSSSSDSAFEVETRVLDEFLDMAPTDTPVYVKLDVEGHEAAVVSGGKTFIRKLSPAISAEVLQIGAFDRLLELLGNDYTPVALHNASPTVLFRRSELAVDREELVAIARYGIESALNYNQRRLWHMAEKARADGLKARLNEVRPAQQWGDVMREALAVSGEDFEIPSALIGHIEALERALAIADRSNQEIAMELRRRGDVSAELGYAHDLFVASRSEAERLAARMQELEGKLAGATARLNDHHRYRSQAEKTIDRLRKRLAAIENSRSWRLVRGYWSLRNRMRGRSPARDAALEQQGAGATEKAPSERRADQLEAVKSHVASWIATAQVSHGPEVVVMFSGTTWYQFKRANRPIRLTKVFLDQGSPVFFNYYRFHPDSLPEPIDKILVQCPIDLTESVLPQVLGAEYPGKKKLLFVSFPHEMMVRSMLVASQHGWKVIYDARDDWEEFFRVGAAPWYEPEYEWYVATHADVVTAVSRPLAQKLQVMSGRSVQVSPNALDPTFPQRMRRRSGGSPVVGYFGHLTEKWFDWELLIRTAEALPTYSFELAGHQAPDVKLPSNVKLLGLLSHDELAFLAARWSVGIIPFKTSPLTDGVDPIKVYEYLHLGLPTVSTFFPQLMQYPGVEVCESPTRFVEAIKEFASSERTMPVGAKEWLHQNIWQHRVDQYRAASGLGAPIGSALLGQSGE